MLQVRCSLWYWGPILTVLLLASTCVLVLAEDQIEIYKIQFIEEDLYRIQNGQNGPLEKNARRCSFLPVPPSADPKYRFFEDDLRLIIETGAYVVVDETGNKLPVRFKELWREENNYPTNYYTSEVPSGGCGTFLLARLPGRSRTPKIRKQPPLPTKVRETFEQRLRRDETSLIRDALCSLKIQTGVPSTGSPSIYTIEPFAFCTDPTFFSRATDKSEKPHWFYDGKDWYIFRHYDFALCAPKCHYLDAVFLFRVDSTKQILVPSILWAGNSGDGTMSCKAPIAVDVGKKEGFSLLFNCISDWEPGMEWGYLVQNHNGKWY